MVQNEAALVAMDMPQYALANRTASQAAQVAVDFQVQFKILLAP